MRHINRSKLIVFLASVSLLVGCAGPTPKGESAKYTKNVSSVSLHQYNERFCPAETEVTSDKNWKKLLEYGNGCVISQKWDRVEKIGEVFVHQDINSPWGPYFKSLAAEGKGQYERSLWMIEVALQKDSQQAHFLFQKARLLWHKGEKQDSFELMERALAQDPTMNSARLFMAEIELRDQQYSRAFKLFSEAKDHDLYNETVYLGMAECLVEKEDWKQVVQMLDEAININRKRLESRLLRAEVLEKHIKDTALALEAYRKIRYLKMKNRLIGALPKDIEDRISKLEAQLLVESKKKKISRRDPASKQEVAE
ncbi:MAG: hypothetical protein KDD61_07870 [Bdellovibrionales bacterium]|nr:hypothetical protein [Bdellovibrionales bacterium]